MGRLAALGPSYSVSNRSRCYVYTAPLVGNMDCAAVEILGVMLV